MKKIVLILLLSLSLLLSCGEKGIEISYDVSAYDVKTVTSINIDRGESMPLPEPDDDWLDFKGWYLDPSHDIPANDAIIVDEDTTLYALFEPSITIAIIGDGSTTRYQEVLVAIDDFSNNNNRLYKTYEFEEMEYHLPSSFDLTRDAIEDAVALGIDLILLTESWLQSEAVYDAQSQYPGVDFVLFGYEPRENYFYGDPTILENTISIKASSSISGFLAGYTAVSDGYQHLGFFGSTGSSAFESSIGFVAGAYYAANQYNKEIFFNERSFKIVERPSRLVTNYFAEGAFDTGTEIIYTPSIDNTVVEQVALEKNRHVILGGNSSTKNLDSVFARLEDSNYHTTMDILMDYFSNQFKGGHTLPQRCKMYSENSSLNQTNLDEYQTLLDRLYTNEIDIPTNYDELILFLETFGMSNLFDLDENSVESVSVFPFD